jgi:hypothetical protein
MQSLSLFIDTWYYSSRGCARVRVRVARARDRVCIQILHHSQKFRDIVEIYLGHRPGHTQVFAVPLLMDRLEGIGGGRRAGAAAGRVNNSGVSRDSRRFRQLSAGGTPGSPA